MRKHFAIAASLAAMSAAIASLNNACNAQIKSLSSIVAYKPRKQQITTQNKQKK